MALSQGGTYTTAIMLIAIATRPSGAGPRSGG